MIITTESYRLDYHRVTYSTKAYTVGIRTIAHCSCGWRSRVYSFTNDAHYRGDLHVKKGSTVP